MAFLSEVKPSKNDHDIGEAESADLGPDLMFGRDVHIPCFPENDT